MRIFAFSIVLSAVAIAAPARADTFHVATTGDDATGDGSADKPWRTIGHAVNVGIPAAGGHTVLVADGVYSGVNQINVGFEDPVLVQAEHPYGATLTNVDGGAEAVRVWVNGPVRITFDGFVMTNAHPTYTCPNGRETYYLVHIQDSSFVTLSNNILFGNNAPGTCNEIVKVNRADAAAYPHGILIKGNVIYDKANAGGADLIDSVRPGEVEITDNIFFDVPEHELSQSFITLKRQAPAPANPSSPRFHVARNVFLHWGGKNDQAFVQLGEDGDPDEEITDALIENNLFIGDSSKSMAAPMQFKGVGDITARANTVTGDLPGGAFGFRIGTEGSNPPVSGFFVRNSVFVDPLGTMGIRLVNSYGLVSDIQLHQNLYWNAGMPLPAMGNPTIDTDMEKIVADPAVATLAGDVVLPRWDARAQAFPSGAKTIRAEFLRLVETYGAIGEASPAVGAADPQHMPTDDIRGYPRDGAPDLGAYEAGAQSPGTGGGGAGTGGGGAGTGGGGNTMSGSGGSTAAGGTSGGGGAGNDPESDGGCGCRVATDTTDRWPTMMAAGALLLVLGAARARRRAAAR